MSSKRKVEEVVEALKREKQLQGFYSQIDENEAKLHKAEAKKLINELVDDYGYSLPVAWCIGDSDYCEGVANGKEYVEWVYRQYEVV